MRQHHYLGALPKISETLWYVASWGEAWVALVSFSASALKCAVRDGWIGWDFRQRYRRLKLVANNSRFLILPEWHVPNLGSRVSPHPGWLQRSPGIPQDGFCETPASRGPRAVVLPHARSTLSNRRVENDAQRCADAIVARFFCRHSRSPPCRGQASSLAHRAGDRRRRGVVWHAGLPRHRRLGPEPGAKGPAAIRLSLPPGPLRGAQ